MSSLSGFEGGELGEANMEDELSDDGLQLLGEKKKRLNMIQVKTLEKSFEMGNKLEPERKMQLAKALGLQPRQIAIWFQNRRARWKTKQLEKDYELLKRQFDAIKQENDVLQDKNQKLHAEIMALKNRQENIESINLNKETEGSCSNRSSTEQICDMNLNISRTSTVTVTIPPMDMDDNNNNNNNNSPLPNITAEDPPLVISSSRPFFPNNSSINTAHSPPHHHHFFQNFASTTRPDFINNQKNMHMDNINVAVKEETLCNMFGFEQDHQANSSGFWPWMEQQHYN